jgi:hypothetical protein
MVLSYLIRDRERFSGGLVGIRASDEKSLLCVETESNTQPDNRDFGLVFGSTKRICFRMEKGCWCWYKGTGQESARASWGWEVYIAGEPGGEEKENA